LWLIRGVEMPEESRMTPNEEGLDSEMTLQQRL
jgi:hypothetical protein